MTLDQYTTRLYAMLQSQTQSNIVNTKPKVPCLGLPVLLPVVNTDYWLSTI